MTPEQLKASILQYAIQGKLVEQRLEEGTAEELFIEIQNEKNALIKEKKIKKEKPQPVVCDEDFPFDIPENWKWVRVGELGSWASGATPSRTNLQFYGGTIPWLKTGDLNDGYIEEVPEYITELALEKTSVRLNPEGSVLMAMYGATIGKLGILNKPMTTNQACCACIPFAGVFNKYLFYFLMSQRGSYIGMAEGGAQPNISKEKIVSSLIPLPPLEEQHRIVAKIEELLPYVDRYAEAYGKLEQFNAKFPENMKKSILQYAIQGKLVEQRPEEGTAEELYQQIQEEKQRLIKEGKIKKEKPLAEITEEEIPFEIPESWKWVHLNNIAISGLGKTLNKSTDTGEEVPYLCSINVYWEGINLDKVKTAKFDTQAKEKYRLQKGDLLICEGGEAGRSAIWDSDEEMYYQNALHRVRFYGSVDAQYMCYVLECYKKNGTIANYTKGIGIQHLVQTSLNSIWLPLPPLEEQHRIVAKVKELLPYCDRLLGRV